MSILFFRHLCRQQTLFKSKIESPGSIFAEYNTENNKIKCEIKPYVSDLIKLFKSKINSIYTLSGKGFWETSARGIWPGELGKTLDPGGGNAVLLSSDSPLPTRLSRNASNPRMLKATPAWEQTFTCVKSYLPNECVLRYGNISLWYFLMLSIVIHMYRAKRKNLARNNKN